MEIPLTQGKVAIIDDADWPLVAEYNWHASKHPNSRWYAVATVWDQETKKSAKVRMHRLILGLTDPVIKGDHKNLTAWTTGARISAPAPTPKTFATARRILSRPRPVSRE
jgi:hypothetical protein